jgi:hypothetical protein
MAKLCREFAMSRKTGHKIFDRYKECGVQGLTARNPMSFGAPITRASSCWAIINTATRTVSDHASRYLLTCEAALFHQRRLRFYVFERFFKERGSLNRQEVVDGGGFEPPTSSLRTRRSAS